MTLENLERIGQLHPEPPDRREFEGLVKSAIDRLKDAGNETLAFASRFDLAYNAAHGLALAALRASGYRTDKRYLVFQCLAHTVNIDKGVIRLFSMCHDRRNLAEYEGHLETDEQLLSELIGHTQALSKLVQAIRV